MVRRTEQLSAASSVGILGVSAVGKEELAVDYLAPALDMVVVNTGKSIRGAAYMAHQLGQFEEGRGNALRLRSGAESCVRDWATGGQRGLHFVVRPPDRSAHIYFGDADMTDVLRPDGKGFTRQRIMEPAAALIAANPTIRQGLNDLWRRAAIHLGGAIMVTKRIDDYLPEAHRKYFLFVTDPRVSAEYRMVRGVSATDWLADEVAYLADRDRLHGSYELDVVPDGAFRIDMTNLLLKRSGMQKAASVVIANLATKFSQR